MEQVEIRVSPQGKVLKAVRNSWLKDLLHGYSVEFPCGGKGSCGRCAIRILKGEEQLSPPDSYHRKRLEDLGMGPGWRLACLTRCECDLTIGVEQFDAIIQADETPFAFEPGSGSGIAVDLGTTTLVAQRVDLETGHILAVETDLNPQQRYGSDLISRLEWALENGAGELREMIRDAVGRMIGKLSAERGSEIHRIVIVGNTVMQHLFCGSDIRPLSFYPFISPDLGLKYFESGSLGWEKGREVRFYPSIGSFVGSDILAGIEAAGMHGREEHSVLIDLGTNGEIVAGNRDRLLCASTAAGPAFEGARISSGMLAGTGAIASVASSGGGFSCRVIGDTEPRGICGSGLIDAVAAMLDNGLVGGFGEILSGDPEVRICGTIALTQKDIQEFQLAKAAIATGVAILLQRLGIEIREVENVFIAGAFGSWINPGNMERTGMLDFREELIHQLGNTALMGARMFLFSEDSETEKILRITSHVNLESEPDFQHLFTENLAFRISRPG